jgi:hypothetical protein
MKSTARANFRRFCLLILVTGVMSQLASCAREVKIQLPDRYWATGSQDRPPSIEINNLAVYGSVDKSQVQSATAGSPELVLVTPERNEQDGAALVLITGIARDDLLGVNYFRIRVEGNHQVLSEVIANQFIEDDKKVFRTLGIFGSDGNGQSGAAFPIEFWTTRDYPVTVSALAMNFGWVTKSMAVSYSCPTCYSASSIHGGGGSTPVGVVTPPPNMGPPPRKAGAFAEVTSAISNVGQSPITSANGLYSASVQPNLAGSIDPTLVVLKSGTKSFSVPFSVGSVSTLIPPIGGVAFTADSSRAIVATFNKPAKGIKQQVSFIVVSLDKAFTTGSTGAISVYETNPVAGGAALLVQPRIFVSQDSTLALVVSAPVGGSPSNLASVSLWDLFGGSMTKLIGSQNVSGIFSSATVSGNQVIVTLSGTPSSLTFNVP